MNPRTVLLASWARLKWRMRTGGFFLCRGSRRSLYVPFFSTLVERFSTLLRLQVYVGFAFLSLGSQRRRDFEKAPAVVQDAFWKQLRSRLDQERAEADAIEETHGISVPVSHHLTEWDEGWQRRSRAIRKAQEQPETDWTPDREADPLRDIPARVYIEALTGEEVPPSGAMACPLPDHDDRNPSFHVYPGNGWRCFGCGEAGSIYDLASALWGIEPRGRGFVEIHKRLRAMFDVGLAAA